MSQRFHPLALVLVTGLLLLGLCSCGGGGGDQTVATVGKTKISTSTLSHWMSVLVGGDYQELTQSTAPVGLVSEPADYPRCVAAAKTIKPKSLPASIPNEARLKIRCRQLHTAVKEQALSYLISVLWGAEEAAELGQNVSDRELSREVQEVAYHDYKSPAAFHRFLASRHWTLADERYLLKRNLLDTKLQKRIKQRLAALGGSQQTYGKLVNENLAKWHAKTSCSAGYTAWQCRGVAPSNEADPSAAVLVEELAGA